MDLSGFDRIVPCGITDCQVCNLNQFVSDVRIEQVKIAIAQTFAKIFDLEMHLQQLDPVTMSIEYLMRLSKDQATINMFQSEQFTF
jgi:lipoate-protein ligase B